MVQGLAFYLERSQPLGHDGHRIDIAPVRRDLNAVARSDTELIAQRFANLHELLRLDDRIQAYMFGPIVEVFRQPVGRRRVGELIRLAERLAVLVEHPRGRIAQGSRIAWAERVAGERGLQRLVMLREWTLRQECPREKSSNAFGVHDERSHAVRGIFDSLEV